jgi:phosphoribosyl-ATP pyrophosphohydrolase
LPDTTLTDLAATIAARAAAGSGESYTAELIGKGVGHCARKLGEEAVETAIAATEGDAGALVRESADLLYHLLVLLQVSGTSLDAVLAELKRREGTGGLAEKAARPKG